MNRIPKSVVSTIKELNAKGLSDTSIARNLSISRWTVAHYLGRAYQHSGGRAAGSPSLYAPVQKVLRCMTCNSVLEPQECLRLGRYVGGLRPGFCKWACLAVYAERRAKLEA